MAHGLKQANDMVYNSQREVPWHGLGVPLPGLATVQEVMAAVPALAARVVKEPARRNGIEVEGAYFTVREDTDEVLGMVGSRYRVLQNLDAFRFMDRLTMDPNGPKYETAGALWGGKRVWLMAALEPFDVLPGDTVKPYLLLSNSHDGSSAVRLKLTSVRVVCANTEAMAHAGDGGKTSVRHSGDILAKVRDVQTALGLVQKDVLATRDLFRLMAETVPTDSQVADLLARLIPDTATKRAELQRARVMELARDGAGNSGLGGSLWALYNGFTELTDHLNGADSDRADAQDARVNSVLFDSGAARKESALDAIREVCLAK